MYKFRNLLVALSFAVVPLVISNSASVSAQTFSSAGAGKDCSVVELGARDGGSFSVSGNTASTNIQVEGPKGGTCKETISMASWNTAYGYDGTASNGYNPYRPLSTQRLLATKTVADLGIGKHTETINVNASCNFQADLVVGSNPLGSGNTADYGTDLMGYTQSETGVCKAPVAPTPAPVAPTPAPAAPASVSICSGSNSNSGNAINSTVGNCSTTIVNNSPTTANQAVTTAPVVQTIQQQSVTSTPAPVTPTPTPEAPVATATSTATATATATPAAVTTPVAVSTPAAAQTTALVNTGPGNVIGIFSVVTVAGAFFHRLVLRRSLAKF